MITLVMDRVMSAKLDIMNYSILNISETAVNSIIIAVMNAMILKDTRVIREDNKR